MKIYQYSYFDDDNGCTTGDKLNVITKDYRIKKVIEEEKSCEIIFNSIMGRIVENSKNGEFFYQGEKYLTKKQKKRLKERLKILQLERTIFFKYNYFNENWSILIDWKDSGWLLNKFSNIYNFFALHENMLISVIVVVILIIANLITKIFVI